MTIRELRQAYLDGATIEQLAIKSDLPQREVRYAPGLTSSYEDRTKKYAELYDKGLNDCEIAAELDVERSTICYWRKRTGRVSTTGVQDDPIHNRFCFWRCYRCRFYFWD